MLTPSGAYVAPSTSRDDVPPIRLLRMDLVIEWGTASRKSSAAESGSQSHSQSQSQPSSQETVVEVDGSHAINIFDPALSLAYDACWSELMDKFCVLHLIRCVARETMATWCESREADEMLYI